MSIETPKENNLDKATKIAKAIIEIIPGAAVGTELLTWFIKLPYQKRLEKWQKDISDTLNELKEKGINLDDLQNNEEFFDILLQAVQIGIRSHQEEKRTALKNAIINSALDKAPDFTKQQIFLNYIDVLTVWHINLLILMNDPPAWFQKNKRNVPSSSFGSVSHIIEDAYPELRGHKDFLNLLWDDLNHRGLLSNNALSTTMSGNGMLEKRTTGLGREFISFITN